MGKNKSGESQRGTEECNFQLPRVKYIRISNSDLLIFMRFSFPYNSFSILSPNWRGVLILIGGLSKFPHFSLYWVTFSLNFIDNHFILLIIYLLAHSFTQFILKFYPVCFGWYIWDFLQKRKIKNLVLKNTVEIFFVLVLPQMLS